MSKLNDRLTLVANLSVVVGIVFLAVELQQNTQAIQAQTRDSITDKQMVYLGWLATSPDLTAVRAKMDSVPYEELSAQEQMHFVGYSAGQFREWENSYYQYERGLFTAEEFEARAEYWRVVLSGTAAEAYATIWGQVGHTFSPAFRAEIDRMIAELAP